MLRANCHLAITFFKEARPDGALNNNNKRCQSGFLKNFTHWTLNSLTPLAVLAATIRGLCYDRDPYVSPERTLELSTERQCLQLTHNANSQPRDLRPRSQHFLELREEITRLHACLFACHGSTSGSSEGNSGCSLYKTHIGTKRPNSNHETPYLCPGGTGAWTAGR